MDELFPPGFTAEAQAAATENKTRLFARLKDETQQERTLRQTIELAKIITRNIDQGDRIQIETIQLEPEAVRIVRDALIARGFTVLLDEGAYTMTVMSVPPTPEPESTCTLL